MIDQRKILTGSNVLVLLICSKNYYYHARRQFGARETNDCRESLAILPNQSLVHTIQARNLVTTPKPNPPNNPTQTRAQKGLEKGEGLIINNEA